MSDREALAARLHKASVDAAYAFTCRKPLLPPTDWPAFHGSALAKAVEAHVDAEGRLSTKAEAERADAAEAEASLLRNQLLWAEEKRRELMEANDELAQRLDAGPSRRHPEGAGEVPFVGSDCRTHGPDSTGSSWCICGSGYESARGGFGLQGHLDGRRPEAETSRCDCGHAKDAHISGTGLCAQPYEDGSGVGRCNCTRFMLATSRREALAAAIYRLNGQALYGRDLGEFDGDRMEAERWRWLEQADIILAEASVE